MGEEGFQIKYDPTDDVMYISVGLPRPAITIEQGEGVFLRVDPDTGEFLGATIVGFREMFQTDPGRQVNLPVLGRKFAT